MSLYYPVTQNGLQKSLGSQLDEGTTDSLTLNNTTGIQNKAGVCVIDRISTDGTVKDATYREYVSFTGVSGSTLTGLTRGLAGSTDQDHAVNAVVEFISDVTQQQAILDVLDGTATGALLNTPSLTTPKVITGINDTNGNELVKVTATASAVNEITIANGATGASAYTIVRSLLGTVYHNGTNTVTTMEGLNFTVGALNTGGVTNAKAIRVQTYGTGAGAMSYVYGISIGNLALYNTPDQTYGIYIDASTNAVGTYKVGIYMNDISGATNNYAIYTKAGLNRFGDQLSIVGSANRVQNIIKGYSSQTANLTEWQNSSGTVLGSVTSAGGAYFAGNVGIGTTSPTNLLSFGGNSSRIFWMERTTTAASPGFGLTVQAGGAVVSGTDKAGGDLTLKPGVSTGSAESGVVIQGCVAGASGTSDRSFQDMVKVLGNKLAFYNQTAVVRPTALTTQLTTITFSNPGTPDYAIQDLTQTNPYGFVTADEAQTVLSVIKNLQIRVGELETKLQSLGLLT